MALRRKGLRKEQFVRKESILEEISQRQARLNSVHFSLVASNSLELSSVQIIPGQVSAVGYIQSFTDLTVWTTSVLMINTINGQVVPPS